MHDNGALIDTINMWLECIRKQTCKSVPLISPSATGLSYMWTYWSWMQVMIIWLSFLMMKDTVQRNQSTNAFLDFRRISLDTDEYWHTHRHTQGLLSSAPNQFCLVTIEQRTLISRLQSLNEKTGETETLKVSWKDGSLFSAFYLIFNVYLSFFYLLTSFGIQAITFFAPLQVL